jgi:hypothetical protein
MHKLHKIERLIEMEVEKFALPEELGPAPEWKSDSRGKGKGKGKKKSAGKQPRHQAKTSANQSIPKERIKITVVKKADS